MNRRSFMRSLLLAGASCAILPGAGRIWKPSAPIAHGISPTEFAKFLQDELPHYEADILHDPIGGWIGNITVGQWDNTPYLVRDLQPPVNPFDTFKLHDALYLPTT